MVHIVLLIQFPGNRSLWTDFSCVQDCCEYICQLYEQRLKRENPGLNDLTYDITDLYAYVDGLMNCSCLISRDDSPIYEGHDRSWVKMKLFFTLRREVDMSREMPDYYNDY